MVCKCRRESLYLCEHHMVGSTVGQLTEQSQHTRTCTHGGMNLLYNKNKDDPRLILQKSVLPEPHTHTHTHIIPYKHKSNCSFPLVT